MGTRHLIAATIDGDFKIAQYGQWDGYPSGQGESVLEFLKRANLEQFAGRCRDLQWADQAHLDAINKQAGIEPGAEWITMEQSDARNKIAPELGRDCGSNILDLVLDGKATKLTDARDFPVDSLFCEWAYVIDLDEGTFTVYKGFQKETPTEGLWAGRKADDSEYGACAPIASWPLTALPDLDAFYEACKDGDEDEE